MAVFSSLITSDNDSDDAYWLTTLANQLADDIPRLCKLRTFYDGAETVPVAQIPAGVDVSAYAVYQRFVELCPANFARIIADSVSSRQKPIGFRSVSDKAQRSEEADKAWRSHHMDVKARSVMHDVAVYGSGYFMVTSLENPDRVTALSPWTARVSPNGDNAIYYDYDATSNRESITVARLIRNDDGSVKEVYSRTAVRDAERPSILLESATDEIYKVYNDPTANKTFSFGAGFEWEGGAFQYDFAQKCGCLPIIRIGSGSGMGQFEPHVPLLSSIDQQRFQRFCIQEMQAFRQRAISGKIRRTYQPDDMPVILGKAKAGDPIDYSQVFSMGPAALWILPDGADIWESQVTDVTQLITAASSDIKHLAAASGTPLDILSPDVAGSASGADLKREGLIFKVEDLNARANDALVYVLRMAIQADDEARNVSEDEMFETVWAPIAPNSDLNMAQAANYVKDILPPKTIMRKFLHMTETEISEAMQDMTDNTYQTAFTAAQAATDVSDETGGFTEVSDEEAGDSVLVDVDGA